MKIELNARCQGKSELMRLHRDAMIKSKRRIVIASMGKNGKPHFCEVVPLKKNRFDR